MSDANGFCYAIIVFVPDVPRRGAQPAGAPDGRWERKSAYRDSPGPLREALLTSDDFRFLPPDRVSIVAAKLDSVVVPGTSVRNLLEREDGFPHRFLDELVARRHLVVVE